MLIDIFNVCITAEATSLFHWKSAWKLWHSYKFSACEFSMILWTYISMNTSLIQCSVKKNYKTSGLAQSLLFTTIHIHIHTVYEVNINKLKEAIQTLHGRVTCNCRELKLCMCVEVRNTQKHLLGVWWVLTQLTTLLSTHKQISLQVALTHFSFEASL